MQLILSNNQTRTHQFIVVCSLLLLFYGVKVMADINFPDITIDEEQLHQREKEIDRIYELRKEADLLYFRGNSKAALPLLEQIQQFYESRETADFMDAINIAGLLMRKGLAYIQLNDYDKALAQFEKELAVWKKCNVEESVAIAYRHLASVYSARGDFITAKANLDTAVDIQERLQLLPDLWQSYHDVARLLLMLAIQRKLIGSSRNQLP